ncbi:hypothetical protein IH601_11115 [Candidatus Bipolaricaulota bacterium]|nr:hypothetical protein [Candidatus Bipolaricaulota bacterium]
MRKEGSVWKQLAMVVLLALVVCVVPTLVAVAEDECYTDVRVSGTGVAWLDGSYAFSYMYDGRPDFDHWYVSISPTERIGIDIYYDDDSEVWWCDVWYIEYTDPNDISGSLITDMYWDFMNDSDALTPPHSGWVLDDFHVYHGTDTFQPDPPRMSGGDPCAPAPAEFVVTALGAGGTFLDRCLDLAEGEEPPMAGLCPLAAVYEVGDLVTGACSIDDEAGSAMRATYIHVYIYSADIAPRPEVITLLDHWTVHYDQSAGGYAYSWDTAGYEPGFYDIYLSFADGSSQTCRIQLVEPVAE